MAANFPKLPGYVPTHDPTVVDHKKISHVKLEKIRNAKNVEVPLHALPRQVEKIFLPEKTDLSKSLSHMQYPNHQGANLNELYEPTFVKLDKQVSDDGAVALLSVRAVTSIDFLGFKLHDNTVRGIHIFLVLRFKIISISCII